MISFRICSGKTFVHLDDAIRSEAANVKYLESKPHKLRHPAVLSCYRAALENLTMLRKYKRDGYIQLPKAGRNRHPKMSGDEQ